MANVHRITVFTGSRTGNSEAYVEATRDFARAAANRGYGIVFGGGNVGLMGILADTALAAGAEVRGVMPESMMAAEVPHPGLTQLDMVPNMHARKQRMAELGDAFVALPGGAGTLEELFEAWTWQQLGIHHKPVGLLNTHGFWDPLVTMIQHMTVQGFMRKEFADALIVENEPAALLTALSSWHPPKHPWKDPARA